MEDGQSDRRLAVESAGLIVHLGAQLDATHVAEPNDLARHPPLFLVPLVGLDDDVGKLLGIDQPAQRAEGELEDLAGRRRRLADLTGGHLHVLVLDGPKHVDRGQVARGHFLRVEPDPHAVVALAEIGHVADAVDPRKLVSYLDRGVVRQIDVVVAPIGRDQIDAQQNAGRFFLGVHALKLHLARQLGHCQRHAVLHQHLSHVQVGAQLEGDGQVVGPVVGALRRHVEHPLDAVDLLLNRGGDAVGHHLGARARIVRDDGDGRRRDVGILRDRQHEGGHSAGQQDDQRNDPGEDRPFDEELGEHAARNLCGVGRAHRAPPYGKVGSDGARCARSTLLSATVSCRSPTRSAAA